MSAILKQYTKGAINALLWKLGYTICSRNYINSLQKDINLLTEERKKIPTGLVKFLLEYHSNAIQYMVNGIFQKKILLSGFSIDVACVFWGTR